MLILVHREYHFIIPYIVCSPVSNFQGLERAVSFKRKVFKYK